MSLLGEKFLQNKNVTQKTKYENEENIITQKAYTEKTTAKLQREEGTLVSSDTLGMISSTSSSSHTSSSNIVLKYIYSNNLTETPKRRDNKNRGLEDNRDAY